MRTRRALHVAALAVGVLSAAALVRADGDAGKLAAAAEEFDEGTKAFKKKDYEEAAAHFEAADRYAPSPASIGNAIRARKSAKQLARAATLSALAIQRHPDAKDLVDTAKAVIHDNEKNLGRVDLTCAPACTLVLDNKVASAAEVTAFTIFLDPGPHTLVASWTQDRSKTTKLEAKKGEAQPLKLEAPPVPPKVDPKPSATAEPPPAKSAPAASTSVTLDPSAKKPLPPWVTYGGAGLTGVLLGVSVWSGIDTQNNPGKTKVIDECAGKTTSCDAYATGKAKERRTNLLFGATAVVGVATGVLALAFTDWSPPKKEAARFVPVPQPLPGGAGVSVGGSF